MEVSKYILKLICRKKTHKMIWFSAVTTHDKQFLKHVKNRRKENLLNLTRVTTIIKPLVSLHKIIFYL